MKKITLLIIFSILLNYLYSQENYQPGYIIDNNGKKIEGYIDYRNWRSNPDFINFKEETNSKESKFGPTDILEFSVASDIYESANVKIEVSSRNTSKLDDNPTLNYIEKEVFLLLLYKGSKDLLMYRLGGGTNHFYIRSEENIEYLVYKKYKKTHTNTSYDQKPHTTVMKNERYKRILAFHFSDCLKIQSDINKLEYTKSSITKLFDKYIECSNSKFEYIKPKETAQNKFGILAGATFTFINIESNINHKVLSFNGKDSYDYTFGIYSDLAFPRNFYKISWYNELAYTQYGAEGTNYIGINTTEYLKFDFKFIELNSMLRYKYPVKNNFIYGNLGFSFGFPIDKKSESKSVNPTREQPTIENDFVSTKNYSAGINIGGGIQFGRISGEVRYRLDISNGLFDYYNVTSNFNKLSLIIGYTINK